MFLVSDTRISRTEKIRTFITHDEVMIAILLAAADMEWTLRRAIITMGHSPNAYIRAQVLRYCHGLSDYKKAWLSEVTPRFNVRLPEIVPDWQWLTHKEKGAFTLRNKLIHGIHGSTGFGYAAIRVEQMLNASNSIHEFAQDNKIDLYSRLPVRRKALQTTLLS